MAKQPKSAAGYVHDSETEYQCEDCYKFEPASHACVEVQGVIHDIGGCNTFVKGAPGSVASRHGMGKLSQLEAGYVENRPGFSCRRCEYFDRQNWDCKKVDKDSPGPDEGLIHPRACCNNWEKDPVFGNI